MKAQILSKIVDLVIDLSLNIVDDVVEEADNTVGALGACCVEELFADARCVELGKESVFMFISNVRICCKEQWTHCDDGVILHESFLGASEETQEGQNERRRAQHHGDQSRKAHGVLIWSVMFVRRDAMNLKAPSAKNQASPFYCGSVASKGKYNSGLRNILHQGKDTAERYLSHEVVFAAVVAGQAPSASPSAPACTLDRH